MLIVLIDRSIRTKALATAAPGLVLPPQWLGFPEIILAMALATAAAGLALPPQWLGFPEVILAMALPISTAGLALPLQGLGLQTGINWCVEKFLS